MPELIITGPPRTGTTALCRLLNTSPRFFIPDEGALYHGYKQECYCRLTEVFEWGSNEEILRRKRLSPEMALKNTKGFFGTHYLTHFKLISGAEVVGDKYPGYVLDMEHWLDRLPEVRVVLCLRHPLAVVASQLRRQKQIDAGQKFSEGSPWATSDYSKACEFVAKYFRPALALAAHERVIKASYETLDVHDLLLRIVTVLDLPRSSVEDFQVDGVYRKENTETWRQELDLTKISEEVKQITYLMGYSI